jgi:6-phosphogluconolactonase
MLNVFWGTGASSAGGTEASHEVRGGGGADVGGSLRLRSRPVTSRAVRAARAVVPWSMLLASLVLVASAQAAGSVYVTNSGEDQVAQFAILGEGGLSPLSPVDVAAGSGPWAVAVSPDGKSAYVTDSGEEAVSQYDINPATGTLSAKSPASVATPTTLHMGVAVTPDGKSAYVTNFNDNTVSQYDINPTTGTLSAKSPATVATGMRPGGVAVTPDGKNAFVPNDGENTVSQYSIDPLTGALSPKSPAVVSAGLGPTGVAVTPDGKSAYVKDVGAVLQYDIDPLTGALSPKSPASVPGGPASGTDDTTPIAVTPDGKSAYASSDSEAEPVIFQYDIDPTTGRLSAKTPASVATATQPSAVAVSPDGKSAYVTNTFSEKISQYNIDPLTGVLSAKTPATVATGTHPLGIAVGPFPLLHPTSTSVSCSPETVVAGHSTTCTATVTDTAGSAQTTTTGTVGFSSSGAGSFGEASCTLAAVSASSASCHVSYTPSATTSSPVRSDTITAAYSGDATHSPSSGETKVEVLSITLLASGSFVIGDQSAAMGSQVTFWGAQWSKLNTMSGGDAPSSFKGFASTTAANPPSCGAAWSTGPGNSSSPPNAPLPEYMAVIASSGVSKSGSTISGNAAHVVVVKTSPGYAPDPGHAGTGRVVGVVC